MPDGNADSKDADIRILSATEAIRLRPAMYIGCVDQRGLLNLVEDLVENAIAAHQYGNTRQITVTLHDQRCVTVAYDGDGVSVTPDPRFDQRSYLEVAFTSVFAGGVTTKAAYNRHSMYHIGMPITTALCEACDVESRIDGQAWRIRFAQGKIVEPLTCRGPTTASGLSIRFTCDPEIFRDAKIDGVLLRRRLRECAALVPGLKIVFHDETLGHDDEFLFPEGALALLPDLFSSTAGSVMPPLRFVAETDKSRLDVAVQYCRDDITGVLSFANLRPTRQQGTHVRGCLHGVKEALRHLATGKRGPFVAGIDVEQILPGLRAVISVDLPAAQFEGPTREKLANHEVEVWCRLAVETQLTEQLLNSPHDAESLLQHLLGQLR